MCIKHSLMRMRMRIFLWLTLTQLLYGDPVHNTCTKFFWRTNKYGMGAN